MTEAAGLEQNSKEKRNMASVASKTYTVPEQKNKIKKTDSSCETLEDAILAAIKRMG
jgi:hypothetical protein